MKLKSPQKEIYGKERFTALEAQRLAQEIVSDLSFFKSRV